MSCIFGEYKEGYRTFSDNIPGFAQGAYFPGDEAGYRCKFDGEYCIACDNGNPNDCGYEKTEYFCPDCFCDGHDDLPYLFNLPQGMTCIKCGKTYTKGKWLQSLNDTASDINSAFMYQEESIRNLKETICELEEEIKKKDCEISGFKFALEKKRKEG